MTLFDSTFNKVFDSYLNWDTFEQQASTTSKMYRRCVGYGV